MRIVLKSFLGTLLAIVFLGAVVAGAAVLVAGRKPKIRDHSWLVVDLHGDLPEYDPPSDLLSLVSGDTETLQRVLDNLRKARVDDRIPGAILRLSWSSGIDPAATEEIRGAIRKLRQAGKKVYGYAESFGARELWLLAACDEIVSPPTAYIEFIGLSRGSAHVKKALDKLGIRPNLHKIKDYKSAAELVLRENMSDPARENVVWMLDEYWNALSTALAEDRGLDEAELTALMEHALFTAEEARARGLIDRVAYWDELEAGLRREGDEELRIVSASRYAAVAPSKLGLEGDRTVAVIHAQGTITGRKSGVNPLLGLTMGHETIVEELRRARKDDDVAAIVFRVDSPGGDALASDLMSHEVERTAKVKPVVVSMVRVAASGGYDISYRASRIVADPMTVTGSIGSISGKFNLAGFYDMLGVTHDEVTRGPMALLSSEWRDYTPEEQARFEENHWASFNLWLRDVAEHRHLSFESAEKLAHGRVWSGRQAAANGLVDELGDLEHAIEVAKRLAEIPAEEEVTVQHFPETKTLLATLLEGGDDGATAARWAIYRGIHEELAETWSLLRRDPALAARLLEQP